MTQGKIPYRQSQETIRGVIDDLNYGDIVLVKALRDIEKPKESHLGFVYAINGEWLLTSNIDPKSTFFDSSNAHLYKMEYDKIAALVPMQPQGPITGHYFSRSHKNFHFRDKVIVSFNDLNSSSFREVGYVDVSNPTLLSLLSIDPNHYYREEKDGKKHITPVDHSRDLSSKFDIDHFQKLRTAYLVLREQ